MFKKYFIPGEHNNHQPHILRRRAVLGILITVLLAEGFFLFEVFLAAPLLNIFSAVLPNILVELTNSDRQQNNINFLTTNLLLEQAATLKVKDMAAKGYFAHQSPDGKTPWSWFDKVGYDYQWAGENLAVNFSDSKDVEQAWMNSEGHRANILNPNFTEIGIAAAQGVYKGQPATFIVQFFGSPSFAKATAGKPSTTEAVENKPVAQAVKIKETPILSPIKTPSASPSSEPQLVMVKESASSSLVIGATTEGLKNSQIAANPPVSFWKKILSMPKTALNYFYFLIAAVVLLALGLKIFVKRKIQYPVLIFNGIIILFVIVSISYFNYLIISQGSVF